MIGNPHQYRYLRETAACLLIIITALIIYLQSHGFDLATDEEKINHLYFLASLEQHGFLKTLLTPPDHFSYWVPVTYLSYIADFVFWGNNPGKHHLSSLFFHIINGLLLFVLFKKMTGKIWTGAFVATLLMIHPLHVEPIAFLGARSVIISTLFMMLALISYVHYVRSSGRGAYLTALACFAAGLMARPSIIHLPLILLVIDYWPLKRFALEPAAGKNTPPRTTVLFLFEKQLLSRFFSLLKEKIPFFLLAAACVAVNIAYKLISYLKSEYFQDHVFVHLPVLLQNRISAPHSATTLLHQIPDAAVSCAGYLWKTLWPTNLSIYLPTPPIIFTRLEIAGSFLLLGLITVSAIKIRKQAPYYLAGWLWFCLAISPSVASNMQVGSFTTDRYAYFPTIGIYLILCWGGDALLKGYKYKKPVLVLVSAVLIILLTAMSWRQTTHWKNELTLYEHALTIEPESVFLHNNFGKALYESGRPKAAVHHFKQALRAMPDSPQLLTNLGTAYYAIGEITKAAASFQQALFLNPGDINAGRRLAGLYLASGNHEKAALVYKTLLAARPDYSAEICYKLSSIYAIQNKKETAVFWLEKSIDYGFDQIELIKNDPNMKNLRNTEYYNSLTNNTGP